MDKDTLQRYVERWDYLRALSKEQLKVVQEMCDHKEALKNINDGTPTMCILCNKSLVNEAK